MIPQRPLGKQGLQVSAIGYGAMVAEGVYGAADETSAIATMHHALDIGMNFIDTADFYGSGHNEILVGKVLKERRRDCILATKFGIVFDPKETGTEWKMNFGFSLRMNGKPAYLRKCLDDSLKRLQVDTIDLWYLHWPDFETPVEDTVGAMAEAVKAGKVHHLGLSNPTAELTRRAHKVHPIAAVQYEYSLWRREVEARLVPTLKELGIGLVPWSPLGNGFLTGTVQNLPKDDSRNSNHKFAGANLKTNTDRLAPIAATAKELGITPAQLALAWLLHQGPDVVPIPGSRRKERVSENAAAASVKLSVDVLKRIDQLAPVGAFKGEALID